MSLPEVAHAERAHREAELLDRLVDRPACSPPSARNRPAVPAIMRLPMKPSHTPETTQTLRIFLPMAITVASTSLAVFFAAHHLQQLHHVGRAEEVQADHVLRALGEGGDLVDVQRRGVAGEDGAGLHHLSSRLKTCFLTAMSSNTASMTMSRPSGRRTSAWWTAGHALVVLLGLERPFLTWPRSSCGWWRRRGQRLLPSSRA